MLFCYITCMLRMNHRNDDPENFFRDMDEEFETLENVIKNALEIVNAYEKQFESSEKIECTVK